MFLEILQKTLFWLQLNSNDTIFGQIGSRRRCAGSQTDHEGVASWQWLATGISCNNS